MADEAKKFKDHVAAFQRDYPDTDLVAYFGPILRPYDDDLIELFEDRGKLSKNLGSGPIKYLADQMIG